MFLALSLVSVEVHKYVSAKALLISTGPKKIDDASPAYP